MVLVVLLHVASWYQAGRGFGQTIWLESSQVLLPLRMPLFFLISGMLASNIVLSDGVRVLRNSFSLFSVYIFWTLVSTSKLIFLPEIDPKTPYSFSLLFWNLFSPGVYWYIWALPIYLVVSYLIFRMCPRRPVSIVYISVFLIFSFLISLFSRELGAIWKDALQLFPPRIDFAYTDSVLRNFVWFFVGVVFSKYILLEVRRIPVGVGVSTFLGLALIFCGAATGFLHEKVALVLAPFPMVFGAILFIRSIESTIFSKLFSYIGRRTISVYIFHWFLLNVLTFLVRYLGVKMDGSLWSLLFPPVATAIIVAICILSGAVLRKLGLGILLVGVPNGLMARARPSQ